MVSHFNDPEHWRQRAEELRAIADNLKEAEPKRIILSVANDYDKLAQRAEQRLAGNSTI